VSRDVGRIKVQIVNQARRSVDADSVISMAGKSRRDTPQAANANPDEDGDADDPPEDRLQTSADEFAPDELSQVVEPIHDRTYHDTHRSVTPVTVATGLAKSVGLRHHEGVMKGVIALGLALRLRDSGLAWNPVAGDRFIIPDRDMDDEVFVLSHMTIEVHDLPTRR